jgi:hypothetical protein
MVKGELYKRSIIGILQQCVTPIKGQAILKDIHERICGRHTGYRVIIAKSFRVEFYWLTIVEDAKEIVKTSEGCQMFAKKPQHRQ